MILSPGKIVIGNNYCWFGSNKIQLPPTSSLPSGLIVMWSGSTSTIPTGWLLCNGSNGTPDLRNRFIVGAGSSYNPGNTGGVDSVTLTVAQMPSHSHTHTLSVSLSDLTCSTSGEHTHTIPALNGAYGRVGGDYLDNLSKYSGSIDNPINTGSTGEHSHTITGSPTLSGSISSTGSGTAHENRPPYYALCFIMKV